jgi:Coenzyme PQQ synthesis protein D (PqqD)
MSEYGVNPRKVVHQTIDGEVIIIQFDTGIYYSLTGAGAEIWALLTSACSIEEIVSRLEQLYDADPGELRVTVERLVEQLAQEDLIELGAAAAAARQPNADGRRPTARNAFQPPVLDKFTDMQDFLLVDPIHEVDDSGWPYTKNSP